MPDDFTIWVLAVEATGLVFTVAVNDVTVCEKHTGALAAIGEKLNPLLVEGRNSVRVSLGLAPPVRSSVARPPATGPFPPDPPAKPEFKLKVQLGKQGVDPGETGILVQYEWKLGQPPLSAGHMSTVPEETFEVARLPWTPPEWTRGASVRADQPALERFVHEYAGLLRSRDVDGAVELNRLKFQDLARCLDLSERGMEEGFKRYLGSLTAAKDWSVTVSNDLHYSLEGHSKLVRITGPDGAAPISAGSNGQLLPFDLTVAVIGGKWCIVR